MEKRKRRNSSPARDDKVAMTVRQFVAEIIRDRFPELGITVVDAKSGGGLQFVRIFYQGAPADFGRIKNQIRYELAQRMNQKFVPELDFVYDDTLESAENIETLLKKI